MAENSAGSPLFAGRYRLQPVSDQWDRGRSGYTQLVIDTQIARLGVLKWAEIKSEQAVKGLKNEVRALFALKGLGVPKIYGIGEAEYDSKKYFYLVIEYIEEAHVQKNLDILPARERIEILTQLFGLLAKAHQKGIVNGDIALKHLIWRTSKDKKQLVVIDWGDARLGVESKKKTEFAWDLARSAEIIYALVTRKGRPPETGFIILPDDSKLVPGLAPLPVQFRNLCKWAPRTPMEGERAPYTAPELFGISKKWSLTIHIKKWAKRIAAVVVIPLAALFFFLLFPRLSARFSTPPAISTLPAATLSLSAATDTPVLIRTPSATLIAAETLALPSEIPATQAATLAPAISPSPAAYTEPILVFDKSTSLDTCWANETNLTSGLGPLDGFSRRKDGYWRFGIEKDRTTEDMIQTDFKPCFNDKTVSAIAMDTSILRLEPKQEFGFFVESANNTRREYTLWLENVHNVDRMYLKVRDNAAAADYEQSIPTHLRADRSSYLHPYYQFSLQIFLEINNQGLDIIYLREGALQVPANVKEIDPSKMKRIDEAVLPTLGDIKKVGIIGYGGETQIALWPLAFFGK
ncbi:MAG TPA: hypothetical protein VK249_00100 [Anaerolineales bacterium]|nr:hypothetical protein [Anaerolineales bacterium]